MSIENVFNEEYVTSAREMTRNILGGITTIPGVFTKADRKKIIDLFPDSDKKIKRDDIIHIESCVESRIEEIEQNHSYDKDNKRWLDFIRAMINDGMYYIDTLKEKHALYKRVSDDGLEYIKENPQNKRLKKSLKFYKSLSNQQDYISAVANIRIVSLLSLTYPGGNSGEDKELKEKNNTAYFNMVREVFPEFDSTAVKDIAIDEIIRDRIRKADEIITGLKIDENIRIALSSGLENAINQYNESFGQKYELKSSE